MALYRVEIGNQTKYNSEWLEFLEMERPALTAREYRAIVRGLLSWASPYDYSRLHALVWREGIRLFAIRCDTRQDGEAVWSVISMTRPGEEWKEGRRVKWYNLGPKKV